MMSKEILEITSPFDHSKLGELPLHSLEDAEMQLSKATNIFKQKEKWIPSYRKIEILEKLIELMRNAEDKLLTTAASEGGKPYQDSKVEVQRAISGIKIAIQEIGNLKGEQVPMGLTASSTQRLAFTVREPIGVVFAISAFNHPLNLIVHQTITAFAAGCPVIIKPASSTPLSCLLFCNLLNQAGVPEGWVQPLICNNEISEKIASDARIAYLSFIGSAKVGWYLKSKLAPGTRCGLEHGGVAPVIVAEDAVIEELIEPLCKGGFYHAGQVCVSVQRIFAHEKIAKELAQKMAARARTLKLGNPLDKNVEVGPIISIKELERIDSWIKEAKADGGEILCGGEKKSESLYLPTVIWNAPLTTRLNQEEIFGPVISIIPYKHIDEAIQQANEVNYHFQSAIFTTKIDIALKCIQNLNATAVMVNDHTAFRVDWMPFGGRDASGEGMGGIPYVMNELTRIKMMVFKSPNLQ
jgi:acyl-CoA reductase-like NAD-dependent aldehyde dehydrogenase